MDGEKGEALRLRGREIRICSGNSLGPVEIGIPNYDIAEGPERSHDDATDVFWSGSNLTSDPEPHHKQNKLLGEDRRKVDFGNAESPRFDQPQPSPSVNPESD